MIYVCYVLFGLGFIFCVAAAFNMNSGSGETLSDVGNALMLLTAVLLLFRAARWGRTS